MAWVRPKPKPADKLESVQWEDEKQTAPPWKNLKAFTREKKVWLQHSSTNKDSSGCVHTRPRLFSCSLEYPCLGCELNLYLVWSVTGLQPQACHIWTMNSSLVISAQKDECRGGVGAPMRSRIQQGLSCLTLQVGFVPWCLATTLLLLLHPHSLYYVRSDQS